MRGMQCVLQSKITPSGMCITGVLLLLLPLAYEWWGNGQFEKIIKFLPVTLPAVTGLFGFSAALAVCILAERQYRRRENSQLRWLVTSALIVAWLQALWLIRGTGDIQGMFWGEFFAFGALWAAGGFSRNLCRQPARRQLLLMVMVIGCGVGISWFGPLLVVFSIPVWIKTSLGPIIALGCLCNKYFPVTKISLRFKLLPSLLLAGIAPTMAVDNGINTYGLSHLYLLFAFLLLLPGLWNMTVETPKKTVERLLRSQHRKIERQQLKWQEIEQIRLRQDVAIKQLSTVVNKKRKLTSTLDELASNAGEYFQTDHVYISLLEGVPSQLWVVAFRGDFQFREMELEEKFMGGIYASRQPVFINDFHDQLKWEESDVFQAGIRSMLGMPVLIDGQLAGVMEVFFGMPHAVTDQYLHMAQVYAEQIALAVRLARLQDEEARKEDELSLLHEVTWLVINQSSPMLLLTRVGGMISKYLRADALAIFYAQPQPGATGIHIVQAEGFSPLDLDRLQILFDKGNLSGLRGDGTDKTVRRAALVSLTLLTGKTVDVLPLFFRQALQGVLVFYWDYERKPGQRQSVEETLRTLASLTAMGLERDSLYSNIKKVGLTDPLTQLANRRLFDYIIKREINRLRRYGRPLSLMMVDIDYFKRINDTWGHMAGDEILKEIGHLLKKSFRMTDFPARYGGEEFVIILPETEKEAAYVLAEKFRLMISGLLFPTGGEKITLTVSVGIATFELQHVTEGQMSEGNLVLAADQTLYRAKNSGRNRVEVWDAQ
ncbi:MAG TPA: sensor domain-containing diguanylate cyclase [Patescibacteria group bacterium]|nr:sensor domain-containing diguanylate cyclase [Patescibacteria group bacterium]